MNFLDYALHHLSCILRILRGDTAALGDMDISADGFWRSFEAFPAALPALFFAWVVEGPAIAGAWRIRLDHFDDRSHGDA